MAIEYEWKGHVANASQSSERHYELHEWGKTRKGTDMSGSTGVDSEMYSTYPNRDASIRREERTRNTNEGDIGS